MIGSGPVTVVVPTGRAGRYADWRASPELLRSWHRQTLCGGIDTAVFFPADDERLPQRHRRERVAGDLRRGPGPPAVRRLRPGPPELHGVRGGLSEAGRRRRLTHP
jgi:hypothetical protein